MTLPTTLTPKERALAQEWMAVVDRLQALIQDIKDALGTAEDGDVLVEVARNAHRAEQAMIADLLDGMNPSAAGTLFERTAERVDTEEFATVLMRLSRDCHAYAARIAPSREGTP
jgi:hypothetical protein